ncbi:hypothetical protein [Streptacidiphilus carbonis]|uniref:hypothetical protein n=1 Tax=Streptacidiphilus carbonis TaxID=105422 RepID=UPI0007C6B6F4|nr:hypothetical protein [Streptacidiphilus carbonis]
MITELAVERVEFTCGHCWRQWSCDYDAQRYTDQDGHEWEYFGLDGRAAESPYTPRGAQACPGCGHRWVGRVLARRPVPTPPGLSERPREAVNDPIGHRAERHHAPLLGSHAHRQPVQPGPPSKGSWIDADEQTSAPASRETP